MKYLNFGLTASFHHDLFMLQAAAVQKLPDEDKYDDFLFDHFSERQDLWFDFMADTGDGGNPVYSVAKLLAQPSVHVKLNGSMHMLPRGDMLLIGGDLA